MKTAISIPDDVYESAEQLAEQLQTTRSELYTKAVRSYVKRHDQQWITDKLNEVCATEDSRMDPAWLEAQARSIPEEDW